MSVLQSFCVMLSLLLLHTITLKIENPLANFFFNESSRRSYLFYQLESSYGDGNISEISSSEQINKVLTSFDHNVIAKT